jgi:hypothetical protein
LYDRVWDGIGDVGRLAPTPHNTQPFRIVPRGPRNADLVVVRDRAAPKTRQPLRGRRVRLRHGVGERRGTWGMRRDRRSSPSTSLTCTGPGRVVVGRATLENRDLYPAGRDGRCASSRARDFGVARAAARRAHSMTRARASTRALAHVASGTATAFSRSTTGARAPSLRLNADAVIDNLRSAMNAERFVAGIATANSARRRRLVERPMNWPAWSCVPHSAPWLYTLPGSAN